LKFIDFDDIISLVIKVKENILIEKSIDFAQKEHIASGIELAAFYAPCD